jgi:hypothetical protein
MAHAGSTTDLAGQPAASHSTLKALLSLVAILAIGIGMIIAVPLLAGAKTTTAPAADSYTQIETQRGATTLSGVSADTLAKAAAAKARAMSGVAPENSLDAAVRAAAAKGALSVDNSYNTVENLRAQRGVPSDFSVAPGTAAQSARQFDPAVPSDSNSFDRTPRGAHGQLP